MVLSVKGSKTVTTAHIRELRGMLEREDSIIGLYLPIQPNKRHDYRSCKCWRYEYEGQPYHRLQICTIEQLLNDIPHTFKSEDT